MMSNKTANATTSKATTSKATANKKNYAAYAASKNYIAYVAYGSNLSVEQMAIRCPDATIIGTGKIRDYKLVFRFHADIEKSKGSYVPVLVWKISEVDEKRLDIYEGVSSGYYHQEEVKVLMDKTPMNQVLMNQVLMNQDDNNDGEDSENGNKDGKGNQSNQSNNAGSNVAGGEDSNGSDVAGSDVADSDVADSNASEITAMVYVMNEQTGTELPDAYYLQIIKDGYTQFGFDKSVLEKALKEAR